MEGISDTIYEIRVQNTGIHEWYRLEDEWSEEFVKELWLYHVEQNPAYGKRMADLFRGRVVVRRCRSPISAPPAVTQGEAKSLAAEVVQDVESRLQ